MAYATTPDMIARFGTEEMIRLSTPAGQNMDGVVTETIDRAISSASAEADSYMRRRYQTPLDVAPPEVVDKICQIARYNLSTGDGKIPSDEVRNRYQDAVKWLRDIVAGNVRLELDEVAPTTEETAEAQVGCTSVFARPWGFGGSYDGW